MQGAFAPEELIGTMLMPEMLGDWMTLSVRETCPYAFPVIDVKEKYSPPSDPLLDALAGHIRDAYFDPVVLQRLIEKYGAETVNAYIVEPGIPKRNTVKRGDFGEAVASGMLTAFDGYVIPVEKLRQKIVGDQTLPGIDFLGLRLTEESTLSEVCFVESKLRTVSDTNFAVDGYKRLKQDYEDRRPDILGFVALKLFERNDAVAEAFTDYMFSREDTQSMETYRMFLFSDTSKWSEKTLENLEEHGVDLAGFTAHAVQIIELRALTDKVYDILKAEVQEDE